MKSKYQSIYEEILERIENEELKPNDTLESESALMKKYDASRDTIRKSLNLLAENGYIQKIKGKKSVILDMGRFQFSVSGVESFKEVSQRMGDKVRTEVVGITRTMPDLSTRKKLNLKESDEVYLIERIRYVDDEAIIFDTDIINAQIVPGLTREIAEDSIYEYIENVLDLNISFAKKEITVQEAHGSDYRFLDMKNYSVVACVKSYSYLDDATIFQFTESRHRPDKFRFVDFARRK